MMILMAVMMGRLNKHSDSNGQATCYVFWFLGHSGHPGTRQVLDSGIPEKLGKQNCLDGRGISHILERRQILNIIGI